MILPDRVAGEASLLVAVDDASTREVVRRKLHDNAVLGKNTNVVLTHLAADVGENLVPVLQLDAEHRIGQWFDYPALDLDCPVLLSHILRDPLFGVVVASASVTVTLDNSVTGTNRLLRGIRRGTDRSAARTTDQWYGKLLIRPNECE